MVAQDVKKNRRAAQAANAGRRKKRRRGKKTIHAILLCMFFLAVGVVLCLRVFFKIESVSVIGTDRYDPADIAASSGVREGDNLWRINKKEMEDAILAQYPYVESLEIARKIPNRVEIAITQSIPAGAVRESGDEYVLITAEGKVLERGIVYIPEAIPLVTGIDTSETQPGEVLGTWKREPAAEEETPEQKEAREKRNALREEKAAMVSEALVMLEYLFEAMEKSGFTDITNVDISDRLNMVILYENRLRLELGSEADLLYKLEFLKTVIGEKLPGDARGTLYAGDAKQKRVRFAPAEGYVWEKTAQTDMPDVEIEQEDSSAQETKEGGDA